MSIKYSRYFMFDATSEYDEILPNQWLLKGFHLLANSFVVLLWLCKLVGAILMEIHEFNKEFN